jgi:hypothetical protein
MKKGQLLVYVFENKVYKDLISWHWRTALLGAAESWETKGEPAVEHQATPKGGQPRW